MPYRRLVLTFDELPEAIWVSVIQYSITVIGRTLARSATSSSKYSYGYLSVDLLLPLLSVSKSWERRILEAPSLWTTIIIDDNLQDAHIKLACCLRFSRQAVLCLHLGKFFMRCWESLFPDLLPHSSRVQTIQATDHRLGRVLRAITREISPLPALVSIMGEAWGTESVGFQEYVKELLSLKMLHGVWTPVSVLSDNFREWEQIDIKDDLLVVLPLLSSIPSLREVHLEVPHSYKGTNSRFLHKSVSGSLPWTSLSYCDQHDVYDLGILQSLVHTLTTFALTGTVTLISKAIIYLPEMLQLHTLTVTATPGDRCILTDALPTCGVRNLTVHGSNLQLGQSENFKVLVKIFPAVTPLINRLYMEWMEAEDTEDHLWFLRNQEYKHLEAIDLRWRPLYAFGKEKESTQGPLSLPESVLWVRIQSENYIFPAIVSAKAESLVLSTAEYPWRISPSTIYSWISLRSLTLLYTEEASNLLSLPYLQKLVLLGDANPYDGDITVFCQQLALSPKSCPSLEHIEFRMCPEWDILMLMLERRNSTQDMGISRIGRIAFPAAYLSRQIRNLLIEMVQGKRSTPMSNLELFELSLAGNVMSFCDPSIPGCLICHKALRFCRYPRFESTSDPSSIFEPTELYYPTDSDELLRTWEERYEEWEGVAYGRTSLCDREDDLRVVYIDEYSVQESGPDWGADDEM